jgi:hypothetical protein
MITSSITLSGGWQLVALCVVVVVVVFLILYVKDDNRGMDT